MGGVVHVDALSLGTWHELRYKLHVWERQRSDASGCMSLVSPKQVAPQLPPSGLLDLKAPTILVLEGLKAQGWLTGTARGARTANDAQKVVSLTSAYTRKCYYQCVLLLDTWWQQGLQSIPRTQTQAFYSRMLHSPSAAYRNAINSRLKAGDYNAMYDALVAGGQGNLPARHVQELANPQPGDDFGVADDPAPAAPGTGPNTLEEADGANVVGGDLHDMDAIGGDDIAVRPPPGAPPQVPGPVVPLQLPGAIVWPQEVDGRPLRYENYAHGRRRYHRLIIACGAAEHGERCNK